MFHDFKLQKNKKIARDFLRVNIQFGHQTFIEINVDLK